MKDAPGTSDATPPALTGTGLEPGTVWEIAVSPEDRQDAAWRDRLLGQVRAALERKLREDPAATDLTWHTPLGTVEVRPRGGRPVPGAPLRLAFAPSVPNLAPPPADGPAPETPDALPALRLPDGPTRLLGERLVGLEEARRAVLLRWGCAWDGRLEAWARQAACHVPAALREHLGEGHAVSLFHGDPGTGKSALAKALADDYARRQGVGGTVLWLTTQARGQGLVGDFSRRLRAAFAQLVALPADELKLLIMDEADALTMRRSEASGHQEDRAATATLLQCLDEVAGRRRLAVILTSNVLVGIDPAVQRRANLFAFERPGGAALRVLLARWLPQLDGAALDRAALAAAGMTPADLERALGEAWLAAVDSQTGLAVEKAISVLREAARTGRV